MGAIQISVLYAPGPRAVRVWALTLPQGSTAWQAILASKVLPEYPQLDVSVAGVGIWGHRVMPDHVLREGDRVEIYRPLQVDPKVARRERFQKQGARTTGLFAKRRAGAKAGY